MRHWVRVAALVVITLCLAGCTVSSCHGGTGHPGERCRSWPASYCDDGYTCVDGICEGCGGEGMRCCMFRTCDGDMTCQRTSDMSTCGDCGQVGERCCSWDGTEFCDDGVFCDEEVGTCFAPATGPCNTAGLNAYSFYVRYATGCSSAPELPITVRGDTIDEARSCAESMLPVGATLIEDEVPIYVPFCQDCPFGFPVETAFSALDEGDARSCATNGYPDCTFTLLEDADGDGHWDTPCESM